MNEKIVSIGKDVSIFGILTEPATPSPKKPMVLLPNAGILHRVGPYRQWVDLARRLSEDGFTVFRFDLTGLGDSDMRNDVREDAERAIADIIEVMDHLDKHLHADTFIIIGLCSGADYGHPVALMDKRVVGTFFIDAYGYRTKFWYIHHYLPRLLDFKKHGNRLRRLCNRLLPARLSLSAKDKEKLKATQYMREFPPREQVEAELGQLVARDVSMFFLYTNGVDRYLNYASQFRAMFPKLDWKNKIEVTFYPESDHTFSLLVHRTKLEGLIRTWISRFQEKKHD
jgi:pimeloyl-ACP methyl ester carboxylesterase